jgi:RHS repeat-associated protein
VNGSLTAESCTYPSTSNKLSSILVGATTTRSLTYDAAGNIATDTRSGTPYTYTYNARNRLGTVTSGALIWAYAYNGLEQLVVRQLTLGGSDVTHFVHDRFGNIIAESDGSGPSGTTREYIWLPEAEIAPTFASRAAIDRPLAVVDGVGSMSPQLLLVHVDHLHRPIAMTDASKVSVWSAEWLPWGGAHAITGTATLNARFPGQWFQLEAGLNYNWHRQYDPSLGRYTQPDPLGFVDGPSVYGYARGSPNDLIDFEGLDVQVCKYYGQGINFWDHVGLGPVGSATRGFYPDGVKQDTGKVESCKVLKSDPAQDECVKNCMPTNPNYSLLTNNCVNHARACLKRCGLASGNPSTPYPNVWYPSLSGSR